MTVIQEGVRAEALTPEEIRGRKESVAGLVLGLVTVLLSWIPLLGLGVGIVGVVFGHKGMLHVRASRIHNGMASAGFILSIIGIVLGSFLTLLTLASAFALVQWYPIHFWTAV